MYTVLLVVHLMIAIALIGLILFQRSSSDGLGSLSGGGNNVMSGRTQANLMTRTTAILATLFILASLALGVLIKKERSQTFAAALEQATTVPTPGEDMKDKADEAATKKAAKDAGGNVAPVTEHPAQAPAKKTAPATTTPAAPAVPKGE